MMRIILLSNSYSIQMLLIEPFFVQGIVVRTKKFKLFCLFCLFLLTLQFVVSFVVSFLRPFKIMKLVKYTTEK